VRGEYVFNHFKKLISTRVMVKDIPDIKKNRVSYKPFI
jgi:hypothetical protein